MSFNIFKGIQLKNMGIDVVLDNKTIGLINAEDSTNITSFDTAIILPKDLVQGILKKTTVFRAIFLLTNT